jgi:hypothetical protein
VDLEFLLTSLYFFVDEWWQRDHPRSPPRPGRPPSLSPSEVLTLAIVAQWPRFRSERDFHSFADAHLREYFPNPHLRPTQPPHPRSGARAKSFPARDVQNTGRRLESLPRAGHHPHSGHRESSCLPQGVVCRQATFGRCASKIEWVCGFKVALSVTPEGVITAFVLAETHRRVPGGLRRLRRLPRGQRLLIGCMGAALDEGPRGVSGSYPTKSSRRAWPEEACQRAAAKRQLIEGVIWQLRDYFGLERHRAKSLGGLLTWLAANVAAYIQSDRG